MNDKKAIGLFGPYNMWYVTRRCYNNINANFYSLTYDDNPEPPCDSVRYETIDKFPEKFVTINGSKYEILPFISIIRLLSMMHPNKPDIIRTFNHISDNIEIISHSHVRIMTNNSKCIKSISELSVEDRRKIWSSIYPNVYDIVDDENIEIVGGDYIFAISSCITPLVTNGGIMPHEERLRSTVEQVQSIRKICPQSKIFLLESSNLNFDDIERLYDYVDYIFLFEKNPINNKLARRNKSLGESYVIHSLLKRLSSYKFFIKFSGRYKLLNKFKLSNLSIDKPTFRVTTKDKTWSGKGVCESILYSIPYKFHQHLLKLLESIVKGHLHIDIEHMLYMYFCPDDDLSHINNVEELNVIGQMAGVWGSYNRV